MRDSLARCILTRSQFGVFQFGAMPVWRVSLWCVSQFCVYVDPVDPVQYMQFCFFCEGQFYLCACFLSSHVFCEEVLPVCREATPLGLLWRAYHFLRIFPSFTHRIVCVIYLLIISTRHRYSIANLFIAGVFLCLVHTFINHFRTTFNT